MAKSESESVSYQQESLSCVLPLYKQRPCLLQSLWLMQIRSRSRSTCRGRLYYLYCYCLWGDENNPCPVAMLCIDISFLIHSSFIPHSFLIHFSFPIQSNQSNPRIDSQFSILNSLSMHPFNTEQRWRRQGHGHEHCSLLMHWALLQRFFKNLKNKKTPFCWFHF